MPFVVVLQSHFLDVVPTVVIAPMMRAETRVPYTETSVAVTFQQERFYVSVVEMVAVERRRLRRPLGNLLDFEYELRRALDQVFLGF